MKSTSLNPTKSTAQLNLFEQSTSSYKKWSMQDIWSPAWNMAIDLAIITTCNGKWVQLKDMARLAAEFAVPNENYPAFSYQVKYLENVGKLLERTNSKTKNSEWTAA